MSDVKNFCFGLEKKRYVTRGIHDRMPIEYQMLMWQWIDELVLEKGNADYLQVFDFSLVEIDGRKMQVIEHHQEVPEYKAKYTLEPSDKEIVGKVFVIDDGEGGCCTMLWVDEY